MSNDNGSKGIGIVADYGDTVRKAKLTAQGMDQKSDAIVITQSGIPDGLMEKLNINGYMYTVSGPADGKDPLEGLNPENLRVNVLGVDAERNLHMGIVGLPFAGHFNHVVINGNRYGRNHSAHTAKSRHIQICELRQWAEDESSAPMSYAQAAWALGLGACPPDTETNILIQERSGNDETGF